MAATAEPWLLAKIAPRDSDHHAPGRADAR